MKKLLHLDDTNEALVHYQKLLQEDFEITSIQNPLELGTLLNQQSFHAILVDIHMNYLGGADVIKLIRQNDKNKHAAIFVLSADNSTASKLNFLKSGIADFLEKDMHADEVRLRIKNGLNKQPVQNNINYGNLEVIKSHFKVEIDQNEIPLTLIEYKILLYLLEHADGFICRDKLTNYLWNGAALSKNTLNTHLCNLKNKIQAWNYEIKSHRLKGIELKKKSQKECAPLQLMQI